MRISVVQFAVGQSSSLSDFLRRMRSILENCQRGGSQLAIFPEYICVDLLNEVFLRMGRSSQVTPRGLLKKLPTLNEEVFDGIGEISDELGVAVVAGTYLSLSNSGGIRNSAEVFIPGRKHFSQSKLHVAYELIVNANDIDPGDSLQIFEYSGVDLSVMVCYDAQFPESARSIIEAGFTPQLLVVPGCALEPWGVGRLRTSAAARAMETMAFVASAHLVGKINIPGIWEQPFWGRSLVCSPISKPFETNGVVATTKSGDEEVLTVDLDLVKLDEARNFGFPRLEDRDKASFKVCQI